VLPTTYLLPLRTPIGVSDELIRYLSDLTEIAEVIVVDASSRDVYIDFERRCVPAIIHVPVDEDLKGLANGKVAGVLTGLRRGTQRYLVIADDDVRYDTAALTRISRLLEQCDCVRPQNYFDPLPWHACLDTARTLINRVTGGDWPGTLAVRRAILIATGGYDGNVLFENLELVRTVKAAGGTEKHPLDLYVRRLPPKTSHFWSQRVRQAYDELARPLRLAAWLTILPAVASGLVVAPAWTGITAVCASSAAAELGRRRANGTTVFPAAAAIVAPAWVAERAVCVWLAVATWLLRGGIMYHGRRIRRAATSSRVLRTRFNTAPRAYGAASSRP